MSPGTTFERVYLALREALGSLRFRPGERLEPALLAQDLNASVTPVRDALHRLVGERLVEAPRHNGFRAARMSELGLRNAYRWHGDLVGLALARAATRAMPEEPLQDPVRRAENLFSAIAAASGNPEHEAAIATLAARLRPARHAEQTLIADVGAEIGQLQALLAAAEAAALRRAIAAYHRRRIALAAEIVASLAG